MVNWDLKVSVIALIRSVIELMILSIKINILKSYAAMSVDISYLKKLINNNNNNLLVLLKDFLYMKEI